SVRELVRLGQFNRKRFLAEQSGCAVLQRPGRSKCPAYRSAWDGWPGFFGKAAIVAVVPHEIAVEHKAAHNPALREMISLLADMSEREVVAPAQHDVIQ